MSNNYHDYVIKDGKFIGKFEEMYRNCPDPWHQDTKEFRYKNLSVELLKILGYESFRKILDIGCGKGGFTNLIKSSFQEAYVLGIDISETAVRIAIERYQDITFKTFDITKQTLDYSEFDCIFMTEIIWYILPYLSNIFLQIYKGLKQSKGVFVLNNHLYQNEEQKYGKEYLTTIETLIEKMPFNIVYVLENNRFNNYDITIVCKA